MMTLVTLNVSGHPVEVTGSDLFVIVALSLAIGICIGIVVEKITVMCGDKTPKGED